MSICSDTGVIEAFPNYKGIYALVKMGYDRAKRSMYTSVGT